MYPFLVLDLDFMQFKGRYEHSEVDKKRIKEWVDKQLRDNADESDERDVRRRRDVGRRHDVLSFKAKPGELRDVAPVEITRNYVRSVRFENLTMFPPSLMNSRMNFIRMPIFMNHSCFNDIL